MEDYKTKYEEALQKYLDQRIEDIRRMRIPDADKGKMIDLLYQTYAELSVRNEAS